MQHFHVQSKCLVNGSFTNSLAGTRIDDFRISRVVRDRRLLKNEVGYLSELWFQSRVKQYAST